MPTVIDALVVTLGLDPKAFTKGQKEAAASMLKTREAAEKHGKGIEKSMDGAAEAVDRLARNALKLFAIFTAGRAIKDFVTDITSADAALGRLAKSVGSTPEVISSLGNAVARNGGSATAAAGSFERLADSINEIKVTGNSSILPFLYRLQGMGGKQINLNKELSDTFADMAENAKNIADQKGVPFATYLLKQAGVDRDTAALMVKGREAYNKALAESRKIGIVRKEDVEAAQKLETSVESLRQTSEGFGRTILTAVTPTVTDLIERMQRWITANQDWIKTEIVEKVRQFAEWLKGIDWNAVGAGLKGFAAGAVKVADAFGGVLRICEALFAFWVGSKAIAIVGSILRVAGLLTSGPLGWAISLAMAGAAAANSMSDKTAVGAPGNLAPEGAGAIGGVLAGPGPAGAGNNPHANEGYVERMKRRWRERPRFLGGTGQGEDMDGIHRRGLRGARKRDDQSGGVAANPGAYKDVLDHIARSEGTANQPGGGYNTSLGYGKYLSGGKEQNLTGKTLDEIIALGNSMRRQPGNPNSSALGRYQIVGSTLKDQMQKLGLKGTDLFDEKTQDRIAANLARQRGADPVGLKNEWASLVGERNRQAVELMKKVDPNASTVPLDNTSAGGASAKTKASAEGAPDPTDGKGVNGDLMKVIKRAQETSEVKFHVHEGLRTVERQAEMVRRGWSKTMNSKHLTGRAIDLRANGDPVVGDLDTAKYAKINEAVAKASKELGVPVEWGGNWKGFKDVPHFQLPDGYKSDAKPYPGDAKPGEDPANPAAALKTSAFDAQRAGAMAAIAQTQAAQAAMAGNTSNDNRSHVDNSSETHIGQITVNSAAQDASGIARDIGPAMKRHAFAAAANYARA